jgi:hypothetical protein
MTDHPIHYVLTVLKEASIHLFGRALPRAMVRAEFYHAVHLVYLPIINLVERNVPPLASSRDDCTSKGELIVKTLNCTDLSFCIVEQVDWNTIANRSLSNERLQLA